ncbi:MAG: hypothetical protein MJB12_15000, partial [Firmicutes bacterium]|nr:hypothetical protein [Bacillota bacterium]
TVVTDYVKHDFSEAYYTNPTEYKEAYSTPDGTQCIWNSDGSYTQRHKKLILDGSLNWTYFYEDAGEGTVSVALTEFPSNYGAKFFTSGSLKGRARATNSDYNFNISTTASENPCIGVTGSNSLGVIVDKVETGITDLASFKTYLNNNPISLIYQLAQEQEYNMNTTSLTCYPNGTLIVEPWDRMVLQSTDIHSIDTTTFTNVDIVRTRELIGYAGGQSGISGNYILGLYPEIAESNIDSLNNVGKSYNVLGSAKLRVVVAKGTYANLAAAQADLAGTVVQYATDPSQTTLPTISYKAPINAAAQRDSNTNAIAQNARILTNHMTKQNAVNLSFDFRITALEP